MTTIEAQIAVTAGLTRDWLSARALHELTGLTMSRVKLTIQSIAYERVVFARKAPIDHRTREYRLLSEVHNVRDAS